MFLPIIRERLVKSSILVSSDVILLSEPDWFLLVQDFPLVTYLLDFLRLLFLLLVRDVLNLGSIIVVICFLFLIVVVLCENCEYVEVCVYVNERDVPHQNHHP